MYCPQIEALTMQMRLYTYYTTPFSPASPIDALLFVFLWLRLLDGLTRLLPQQAVFANPLISRWGFGREYPTLVNTHRLPGQVVHSDGHTRRRIIAGEAMICWRRAGAPGPLRKPSAIRAAAISNDCGLPPRGRCGTVYVYGRLKRLSVVLNSHVCLSARCRLAPRGVLFVGTRGIAWLYLRPPIWQSQRSVSSLPRGAAKAGLPRAEGGVWSRKFIVWRLIRLASWANRDRAALGGAIIIPRDFLL